MSSPNPRTRQHPLIRTYHALDGYRLHYRHWLPARPVPFARVVALHGIQSHSGWYGWSSAQLAAAGYEVYFLDRRGSGMNEPGRGDVASCEVWLNDVVQFLSELRVAERVGASGAPLVLLGVSWGGKLATAVASRRPDLLDGLALLYPGLCARVKATWWQQVQLRLAETLGIRRRRVPIPLQDPALFTGQPEWQEFVHNDPLALRETTVSFLLANRDLDRLLCDCPPRIRRPVLLMLAGRDQIIDNPATRAFVARFATADVTTHEYREACHTLEFEPDRQIFIEDLLQWLRRRRADSG